MTRTRVRLVLFAVMALTLAGIPATAAAATGTATIDFEPGLSEGNVVTSLSSGVGISGDALPGSVAVTASGGSGDAVVFDSDCPSGTSGCTVDPDLDSQSGNVLVVSADGSANDHAGGGSLTFDLSAFGPGTFTVVSLQITDFGDDGANGSITVDGAPSQNAMVPGGDGNVQTVIVNKVGSVLVVSTNDSFSVDSIMLEWDTPPDNPGTGTIGYWMRHPDAWPVDSITVGGITYTKAEAISEMVAPGRGDKTYDMFPQLVAAMLNVEIGNDDTCIAADITAADAWMTTNPLGSNVRANSAAWQGSGSALHGNLDDYNNGDLCAPHRG